MSTATTRTTSDELLRMGVRPKLVCITVHRPDHTARSLKADHTLTCPELLPGFELTVGDIFR